jgi:molybdopterin converting factor small subunit
MFGQLWPVTYSVKTADDCRFQSPAREKIKFEEEAFSKILVADTVSELGSEASEVEDWFEEQRQQQQSSAEVSITNTGQRTPLRCRLCSSRGQRKGTQCARGDVGLCVVLCFAKYHTKVNL